MKPSGAAAAVFTTAVDDLPTPSGAELPRVAGTKRTAWASEAGAGRRAEILGVLQAVTLSDPADVEDPTTTIANRNVPRKRKQPAGDTKRTQQGKSNKYRKQKSSKKMKISF